MGAPIFSQIQDRNTLSNFWFKKNYAATIKNNNGAVAMRNFFMRHEQNQQLHQIEKNDIVE